MNSENIKDLEELAELEAGRNKSVTTNEIMLSDRNKQLLLNESGKVIRRPIKSDDIKYLKNLAKSILAEARKACSVINITEIRVGVNWKNILHEFEFEFIEEEEDIDVITIRIADIIGNSIDDWHFGYNLSGICGNGKAVTNSNGDVNIVNITDYTNAGVTEFFSEWLDKAYNFIDNSESSFVDECAVVMLQLINSDNKVSLNLLYRYGKTMSEDVIKALVECISKEEKGKTETKSMKIF